MVGSPQSSPLVTKGTAVEVSSDKEGFKGAWFRAIILSSPPKSGSKKRKRVFIEYSTLVTKDRSRSLTEYIDPIYIRPLPPQDVDVEFGEGDSVDAYYRDGWWTGVIKRVVRDSKYTVFFENPPDVIDIDRKSLRLHLDWVDGKWIRPEKQLENPEEKSIGDPDDEISLRSMMKKNGKSKKDTQASTSAGVITVRASAEGVAKCISKKVRSDSIVELASPGMRCLQAENSANIQSKEALNSTMGEHHKHLNGKAEDKDMEIKQQKDEWKCQKRKSGRPRKLLILPQQSSSQGSKNIGDGDVAGKVIVKDSSTNGVQLLAQAAAECTGEGVITLHASAKEVAKKCISREVKLTDIIGLASLAMRSLKTENSANLQSTEVLNIEPDHHQKHLNDQAENRGMENYQQKDGRKCQKRKRGRPRKLVCLPPHAFVEGNEYGAGDVADKMMVKDTSTNEVQLLTQALGACTDLSPGRTFNQGNKAIESRKQLPAVDVSNDIAGETQRLPFVKTSPLWETIESMEIFLRIPQNPHFHPLIESKEEWREGLAIGHMITFSNLVSKIAKLRVDDTRSVFDSTLETLLQLEKHGFNVKDLQDRVGHLLSNKAYHVHLEIELEKTERLIMEQSCEKEKLDGEKEEIKKKIIELEERYAMINSKKDLTDQEIAKLHYQVNQIDESMQRNQHEFEKIAVEPLM